jgi:uncharacterized protein with HEPN domain
MSKRSNAALLSDMLDHAREAVAFIQGKARADLDTDRLLNLALVRLLEIIGEAASQLPKQEQLQHPQIPWPQIVSLRNRLIHGYNAVDLDIVWQIITSDLPPPISELEASLDRTRNR